MRLLARLTLSGLDLIDQILPIGGPLTGLRYYLARYLINQAKTDEARNQAQIKAQIKARIKAQK